jgi:small subunit ribosomal protein S6
MRYYELTYLISPELSEKEIEELQKKISSLIEAEGGKVEKFNKPAKRKLRYPIKKKEEGYLATLYFYCLPQKLANLDEKFKKDSSILRYLILTKKTPKKEVKALKIEKKAEIKKEKKVKLEEIDKKLEEILGQI